jgi:predicted RNA-binding Zn-ribbon protein involved in translation (DUF1610 family)
MPEVQQCTLCGRTIESGELFVKFKNPIPYFDCHSLSRSWTTRRYEKRRRMQVIQP